MRGIVVVSYVDTGLLVLETLVSSMAEARYFKWNADD